MLKGFANAYIDKKDFDLGIENYEKYLSNIKETLELNPNSTDLQEKYKKECDEYYKKLFDKTRELFNLNEWVESLKLTKKLIKNNYPDNSLYKFASFSYKNLKQHDIRLEFIKKYVELEKNDKENNRLLGEAVYDADKDKNAMLAINEYKKHLEKNPKDSYIWNMIGHIYASTINKNSMKIDDQLYHFNKALEIAPDDTVVLRNIAMTYLNVKDNKNAFKMYEHIIKNYPQSFSNDDYFNYAAALIKYGDFEKGFKYYEKRMIKETEPTAYPEIKKPKWDGTQNISDATLLVHFEQGYGDVILFIRLVKEAQKYAKKVIAVIQKELFSLFNESNLGFEIHPSIVDLDTLDFDYHVPLINLPSVLKLTATNIPYSSGYLSVDKQRVRDYGETFINTDKIKVGINLEGAESGKGQKRDIDWKYLEKFGKLHNIQLYSLNRIILPEYLDKFSNIICLGNTFQNFADTAAAIKNMDLVISTDNVILNLAGAIGVKTFGLFNFDYEYRWYNIESGKTVWYDSIKTFVTESQNNWEEVIDRVIAEIKENYPTRP